MSSKGFLEYFKSVSMGLGTLRDVLSFKGFQDFFLDASLEPSQVVLRNFLGVSEGFRSFQEPFKGVQWYFKEFRDYVRPPDTSETP